MKLKIVLLVFLTLVVQHVYCSCNIPPFIRIPCSKYELTRKLCLEAGCCYNENGFSIRKCFKKFESKEPKERDMLNFNPTIVPRSEAERVAEDVEDGVNYYPKYLSHPLIGIRRVGLSKVRLVCHATERCYQNTPYRFQNTRSSCYRQGCCFRDGVCYQNIWLFLKLCPPGSFCEQHCEKKKLCNTGTCVAQADSPGFTCTCPYGTCGDYCERTDDCFKFQVTSGTHQPYDDSAIVCSGVGTDGQIVSRILTSEGASYHAQITATLAAAAVDKYFLGIKGISADQQYKLVETGGDAESGLMFRWNDGSAPDYPTTGGECVLYNKATSDMTTMSCSQENYALCQYSNA